MCRTISITYNCGHEVLARLSTCRGTYGASARSSGTSYKSRRKDIQCTSNPHLHFRFYKLCGPCSISTLRARREEEEREARELVDRLMSSSLGESGGEGCAARLANAEKDLAILLETSWEYDEDVRKKFPDRPLEPKYFPIPSHDHRAQRGSPLKSELSPDDIPDPINPSEPSDDSGSMTDQETDLLCHSTLDEHGNSKVFPTLAVMESLEEGLTGTYGHEGFDEEAFDRLPVAEDNMISYASQITSTPICTGYEDSMQRSTQTAASRSRTVVSEDRPHDRAADYTDEFSRSNRVCCPSDYLDDSDVDTGYVTASDEGTACVHPPQTMTINSRPRTPEHRRTRTPDLLAFAPPLQDLASTLRIPRGHVQPLPLIGRFSFERPTLPPAGPGTTSSVGSLDSTTSACDVEEASLATRAKAEVIDLPAVRIHVERDRDGVGSHGQGCVESVVRRDSGVNVDDHTCGFEAQGYLGIGYWNWVSTGTWEHWCGSQG